MERRGKKKRCFISLFLPFGLEVWALVWYNGTNLEHPRAKLFVSIRSFLEVGCFEMFVFQWFENLLQLLTMKPMD